MSSAVKNEEDFNTRLDNAKKSLVVVHFWATWAEQCTQMNEVTKELAKKNPNVMFLCVEAEEIPEISLKYEVEAVPTFIFIKNKQKIGRLDGASAPDLTKMVKQHIDAVAPAIHIKADPKEALKNRLKSLINSAPCILFMKGTASQPRCGFSRQMITILNDHNCKYSTFDILEDEAVRQGLKEYSNWPTYPQLYVNGELMGGLDIVRDMAQDGELKDALPLNSSVDQELTLSERIKALLEQNQVILFMKGEPTAPRCGFSRQIVDILNKTGVKYSHFDVFSDEEIRQGLKKYSDWPTYPQLYVAGELLGGLDIVKEMEQQSELKEALMAGSTDS
ncbi:glutaredoxin-3-like [Clavelina lepadiformis]|uniref:glutaredoxin-3-like n=1 Tax=Clavelina lepadiformis TaxID=159417 RepID=UPI0040435DBE